MAHHVNSIAGRAPPTGHVTDTTTEHACDGTAITTPSDGGGLCLATTGMHAPTTFAGPIVSIVEGDGDLLPPRYSGDRRMDADN